MKGVMVAGQYGTGKTETIRGLIRTAAQADPGLRIGAFVTESANIALDAKRYGGADASGVSFASVCCPTLADMRQAMDTALRDRRYDLLFLEPPGNMHPPLMAQVAVEKGIELEQVVMLVSQRDFEDDRHTATFRTGLEMASVIGITHRVRRASSDMADSEMIRFIRSANPSAPTLSFGRGGLAYPEIERIPCWSVERLAGVPAFGHSDHYQKVLRVVNPDLRCEEVVSVLERIAETGEVARAKGQMPAHNRQFDMKGKSLEITTPETPMDSGGMGYAVFFGRERLPLDLIDKVSLAPGQMTRLMRGDAPAKAKFAVFGRLYAESQSKMGNVTANGRVTHTYTPVDDAEKLASEIYRDTGDDSALRMILPFYHGTRLCALAALGREAEPDAFVGVHVSAVLINTSLAQGGGIDYPAMADQHQVLEIRARAVPALLRYASKLGADSIKDFPRYESAVGPYFLRAAKTGWDRLGEDSRASFGEPRAAAGENMARIHREAGFEPLAREWEAWE
jgi:G3E family GTPase